jgi:hypothetical protein
MKRVFFSLVFMFLGTFAFASNAANPLGTTNSQIETNRSISSIAKLEEALKDKNLTISNIRYDENNTVCGFTLSYDDGYNSWSTWYDCGGMNMDQIWNFLQFLLAA